MSLKLTLRNVDVPLFSCERCSESFEMPLQLKYHKFRVHNSHRPYHCKRCKKSFRRINELQQHSRRHRRGDTSSYMCTVCDEYFKSRSLLKNHQGVHTHFVGDHGCGYCNASFLQLAEARLHVLLVHSDPSVLPHGRPLRKRHDSGTADGEDSANDVFCVKEGEGLKIKLKRKLSTDAGAYEQHTTDLNPGSHTSDSGKGNSDMDEEDLLRNGNPLLKMPTLVIRHNDNTVTTTQHKLNHDPSGGGGLLMRPKLELEQTQWGASKIQPRLDSSDFLSKTNFSSNSLNSSKHSSTWGSKLTPPIMPTFASPPHSSSFSSGMLNGGLNLPNLDTKPPQLLPSLQSSQLFSSSNFLSNSVGGLFNSKSPSSLTNSSNNWSPNSTNFGFGNKKVDSGFVSNGSSNHQMFKTPIFLGNAKTTARFGQPTVFGSNASSGLFSKKPSSFMNAPNKTVFGMSAPALGNMGAPFSTGTNSMKLQPRIRNGETSHEPVFGSREKVRSMVATKEEKDKQTGAFSQYAGAAGETNSNPFATAMKKAKNPSPRRRSDSELFEESSSSYYSESEEEEEESGESEEVSGFTDEDDNSVSVEDNEQVTEHPRVLPRILPTLPEEENSVPGAVAMTPLQVWASPHPVSASPEKLAWLSPPKPSMSPITPAKSPTKKLASPALNHVLNHKIELNMPTPWLDEEPFMASPARDQKAVSIKARTLSGSSHHTVSSTPPPSPQTKKRKRSSSNVIEDVSESPPAGPRTRRRRGSHCSSTANSIISEEHLPNKASNRTPNHVIVPPATVQQPNGDLHVEERPMNEVSGHIDFDTPSMTISIPKVLLNQLSAEGKPKTKTRAPSSRLRRHSARTPNPYATTTPSFPPATPVYPPPTPVHSARTPAAQTPVHPSATPHYPPATPHYPSAPTPAYTTPSTLYYQPPPTPVHSSSRTPSHTPAAIQNVPNRYNPRLRAPTKQEMMERMRKQQPPPAKKKSKVRLGPKSFMHKISEKIRSDSDDELPVDNTVFYKSELLPALSGRTDKYAPYNSGFKQNQLYLCYLRRRALDLIITLFPNLRCGGHFCEESDDIDGLIDYIITSLENHDSPQRCMQSMPSKRKDLQIKVCRDGKSTIRALQRKLCKLLKLMLPSLSLQMMTDEGIQTLPKLIHKVITENSVT